MVDTEKIKINIEPYIRSWLSTQFPGHIFSEQPIKMIHDKHKFDGVSEDGTIVAAFLCNRAKTSGNNENTGAVRKALNDISYLKSLPANIRTIMIFTDEECCELVRRRSARLGTGTIDFMVCKLPPKLKIILFNVLNEASKEQHK